MVLCETHLTDKDNFTIPGYNCFRRDCPDIQTKAKGGLATYVRTDIGAQTIQTTQYNRECLCVEISFNDSILTIMSVYDNDGRGDSSQLNNIIKTINGKLYFLGDLNAHNVAWGCNRTTGHAVKLHDDLEDAGLLMLNTGDPTYLSAATRTPSALDLSYCSTSLYSTSSWRTLIQGTSDHYPILVCNSSPIKVWQWTKKYWKIKDDRWDDFIIKQDPLPPNLEDLLDINLLTEHFNKALISAGESVFGLGCRLPFSRQGPPWWNYNCRKAIANRNRARYAARSHRLIDYISFKKFAAIARKVIRDEKRLAWEHFCTHLSHSDALSAIWKRARNQSKSWNTSFPKLERADGTFAITDAEKATALLEPYAKPAPNDSITTTLNNAFIQAPPATPTIYTLPITLQEIDVALRSARLGAMGPDLIPYQFLLHLAPHMKSLLLKIYNICFSHALIPTAWKTATLLPILKPGKNPNLPNSYRPIALASCTLKTLEKIIANRLHQYLELNNKIPDTQYGFRKGRGCTEAINSLITDIKTAFAKKEIVICAFMDIHKAFDYTRHEAIRAALRKLQVPKKIYDFCSEYLCDRNLCMTVGNSTVTQSLNIGVPQGGPLSASLFSTVMCQVPPPPLSTRDSTSGLYADDTRIHSADIDIHSAMTKLNSALDVLHRNSKFWGVEFDPQKSRVIIFCPPRKKIITNKVAISFDNSIIPITTHHKFLGITFDSSLNWKYHVAALAKDCHQRLNLLKSVANKQWGYHMKTLRTLYVTLIRSKILYSLPHIGACSATTFHTLEIIQNKALRIILGLPTSTAVASMEVLANLIPLRLFLEKEQMNLTLKMLARNDISVLTLLLRRLVDLWRSGPPASQIGLNLLTERNLVHLIHQVSPLPRISPIHCWLPNRFTFNLDWLTMAKKDANTDVLLQLSIDQLVLFPGCKIYTDGAYDPNTTENGIGIFCPDPDTSMLLKMPKGASIYTVELTAIWIAIRWALSNNIHSFTIVSDSQSALNAIRHHQQPNNVIYDIYKLDSDIKISFLWVPSHIGLLGNENADRLASTALKDDTLPVSGQLPLADTTKIITASLTDKWNYRWARGSTGRFLHSIFQTVTAVPDLSSIPRADQHLLHALATNRIYLQKHLHLLGKSDSNLCEACQEPEDTQHYLLNCGLYDTQRQTFTNTLSKMDLPLTVANILGGATVPPSYFLRIITALSVYVRTTVGFNKLLGLRKH